MKKLLTGLVLAAMLAVPVAAQVPPPSPTQPMQSQPAAAPAPMPSQTTTIETTRSPVTTTVSVGDLGSQVLSWVLATFGTVIGGGITLVLVQLLKLMGIKATDALRDKLQQMVVNGLNLAGAWAEQNMRGKGKVEIKDEIVARTVQYVQEHGAETMKKIGADPLTQQGIEAIKARIETAIADPATPTPEAITPKAAIKVT